LDVKSLVNASLFGDVSSLRGTGRRLFWSLDVH
jgi:hypothetical protein